MKFFVVKKGAQTAQPLSASSIDQAVVAARKLGVRHLWMMDPQSGLQQELSALVSTSE